jgi:hypothetical protein
MEKTSVSHSLQIAAVRALAANPQDAGSRLRLSAAARKTLEQAEGRMARASAAVLPPLAHYYAAVADLVRRIAVGLHILDHAARQADRISAEIGKDVMLRAIGFVERCVLPAACSVLAPASVAPEERNARRRRGAVVADGRGLLAARRRGDRIHDFKIKLRAAL